MLLTVASLCDGYELLGEGNRFGKFTGFIKRQTALVDFIQFSWQFLRPSRQVQHAQ
jgi:hypothetical protein